MLIWALGTLTHRLEGANAKSIASPPLAAPRSAHNGTAAARITSSLSEDRLVSRPDLPAVCDRARPG
jgi:hypothetical protein